jgi:hypothetical protein
MLSQLLKAVLIPFQIISRKHLNGQEVIDKIHKGIREEKLLQLLLWKMVHFALFLVKISMNFSTGYSTVFSAQWTSLLYKNFKTLVQCCNQ